MDSRLSRINTLWSVVRNAHDSQEDVARQAQQRLWEQYSRAARSYLGAALRDDEAIDEVMQELALKLVRQDFRNASPDKGSFRAFMKTVLFRMVADYRRRQSRNREHAAEVEAESGMEPAQQEFALTWREEVLSMAWARLEELEDETGRPWNSVLRAKIDHPGKNSGELAAIVNGRTRHEISEGNYRVMLHRAREKFAEVLVEQVAHTLQDPTPAELEQELAELQLLEFCQDAIGKVATNITPPSQP